jgi:hypothetical protein
MGSGRTFFDGIEEVSDGNVGGRIHYYCGCGMEEAPESA